jgi:hypothetical protein
MNDYIKVLDHPDLVRDKQSKAILNTDLDALNKYKEERNFKMKLAEVVRDNEQMKSDIADIKNLLIKVLEQNK